MCEFSESSSDVNDVDTTESMSDVAEDVSDASEEWSEVPEVEDMATDADAEEAEALDDLPLPEDEDLSEEASEEYEEYEEDPPKVLTREITDGIRESRAADTEEVLDNYRENLREYGVDEDKIEEFINGEREAMEAEYESLDHGQTSEDIYYMPQDWQVVADSLMADRMEELEPEGDAQDSDISELDLPEETAEDASEDTSDFDGAADVPVEEGTDPALTAEPAEYALPDDMEDIPAELADDVPPAEVPDIPDEGEAETVSETWDAEELSDAESLLEETAVIEDLAPEEDVQLDAEDDLPEQSAEELFETQELADAEEPDTAEAVEVLAEEPVDSEDISELPAEAEAELIGAEELETDDEPEALETLTDGPDADASEDTIDYDRLTQEIREDALRQGFEDIDLDRDPERLDHTLEAFEQPNWDELGPIGRKEAMGKLADYIIDTVDLEERPRVEYYNNPRYGEYGAYDANTNTLRVNEYMLDNAEEAADTIAHELWHAHQYECAQDPQNALHYQYQYNLDPAHYIPPDLGLDAYEDQFVEAEARAFASQIRDRLAAQGRR